MDRRLPARVLAVLALAGVSVALYTVVTRTGAGPDAVAPRESATGTTEEGRPAASSTRRRRSGRRTYTIRAGDTPSGIAERTGVPVSRLLDLNPDLDAQALQTGTKLKLR